MKKKIFIFWVLFIFVLSPKVSAQASISADLYFFEDLTDLGYNLGSEEFHKLPSAEKRQLTSKLRAYSYSSGLIPRAREEFIINKVNKGQGTYLDIEGKDLSLGPRGYYLFIFDKALVDKRWMVQVQDLLIYYEGPVRVNPKIDSEPIDCSFDQMADYLDVIFDLNSLEFPGPLRVGLYDSTGQLIDELILDKTNNYRGGFKGLDFLKNYSIWPESLGIFGFTIDRSKHLVIIKLLKDDNNDQPQDPNCPQDPGDTTTPQGPGESYPQGSLDESLGRDKTEGDQDLEEKSTKDQGEENPEEKGDLNPAQGPDQRRDQGPRNKQTLPQTGSLWLPVPFLLAAGLIFLLMARKKDE